VVADDSLKIVNTSLEIINSDGEEVELISDFMINKSEDIKKILEEEGVLISLLDMTGDGIRELLVTMVHAKFSQHEVWSETIVYDLIEQTKIASFSGGWDSVKCYYDQNNQYVGIIEEDFQLHRGMHLFVYEMRWEGTDAIVSYPFAFIRMQVPREDDLEQNAYFLYDDLDNEKVKLLKENKVDFKDMDSNSAIWEYVEFMSELGEPVAQKEEIIWIFGYGYGDGIEFAAGYEEIWDEISGYYKEYHLEV
jgi:hypothetical protein